MSFYIKNILVQAKNCYRKLIDMNKSAYWKLQMCGTEEEMREVAARICRNYLHGAWKSVDPNDLDFKRINGGLSNFIYYVALPSDLSKLGGYARDSSPEADDNKKHMLSSHSFSMDEPKKVLLRIYGQVHGERAMDAIVTESVIFTLLSERRLGPKLHGVFSGGRIEEYIPARSLITKELSEPAISMKIAEKMAAIHSMDVPLSKEPNWLWKTMGKWMKTARDERLAPNAVGKTVEEQNIIKQLKPIDFEKELEWLKKFVSSMDSPVVFCHNDLQEGNILLLEDEIQPTEDDDYVNYDSKTSKYVMTQFDDQNTSDSITSQISDTGEPRLVLIDFEYCAYNHRGFDIANHFQEWAYDYTNPKHPFYYENLDNLPTLEQKEIFIKEYLKHYHTNLSEDKNHVHDPSIDEINQLLNEVEGFTLVTHLLWCLWSIVNASKSQIPFGYWEFALCRKEHYMSLKQEIMKKDKFGFSQKRKICEVDI
ncbi:choline/ethanolamine kinase isoform X6 [Bicyclus anynana]|uniref:Choline/ethanolamine kinase isoform X6 n=1 Tax=Bicyclus anynana TaxID=110368 RepID=A0A6J1NEE6_BICAN|nr:choline/ethanolamine kinase isoform X6 [Bicyclus anynana]